VNATAVFQSCEPDTCAARAWSSFAHPKPGTCLCCCGAALHVW
jgi:hypothetical protein